MTLKLPKHPKPRKTLLGFKYKGKKPLPPGTPADEDALDKALEAIAAVSLKERPAGIHPVLFGINPMGRPRIFQSNEELLDLVTAFFITAAKNRMPLGIFGLVMFLGITYETFLDYERGKRDTAELYFSEILKRARLVIAWSVESKLDRISNSAGPIFHLQQITRGLGEQWKNAGHYGIVETVPSGKDVTPVIILPDNGRDDPYKEDDD